MIKEDVGRDSDHEWLSFIRGSNNIEGLGFLEDTGSDHDVSMDEEDTRPRKGQDLAETSGKQRRSQNKITAYLTTPWEIRETLPAPTSLYSLTPPIHNITESDLNDDEKKCFFSGLVDLKQHLDTTSTQLDLNSFDDCIRKYAFYEVYPKPDWLQVLTQSRLKEDIRVSAITD